MDQRIRIINAANSLLTLLGLWHIWRRR